MGFNFVHTVFRVLSKNVTTFPVPVVLRHIQFFISPHKRMLRTSTSHSNKTSGTISPFFDKIPATSKDILLYVNKNQRYYRWMTLFGASQFVFWNSLAAFFQDRAEDVETKEEMKTATADARPFVYMIRDALDFKNKYKHGITLLLSLLGCGFLLVPLLVALRNVHMVVLRKGGQTVDIVTFALFGSKRTIAKLPLDHVSCQHSMHAQKPNLALKIKGRSMFFLVDTAGHFPNPKLFEQTVGLHRTYHK